MMERVEDCNEQRERSGRRLDWSNSYARLLIGWCYCVYPNSNSHILVSLLYVQYFTLRNSVDLLDQSSEYSEREVAAAITRAVCQWISQYHVDHVIILREVVVKNYQASSS